MSYLPAAELKIIFGRGIIPIFHSVPAELVTENNIIISNPINLLTLYHDLY